MKKKCMSKEMYNFIAENESRLEYDLELGKVITPKGTNGAVCSSTGYLRVKVRKKTLQVHQILAVKYFGEACVGKQVNHKDGDKLNNSRNNLELVTQKENIQHAWKTGLNKNSTNNSFGIGSNHFNSKLNEEKVRSIRSEKGCTAKQLAEKYSVSVWTINDIRTNKIWKHVI